MTTQVFITRQPVLNKQRAITANRLALHPHGGTPNQDAADALNLLADVWPTERTVLVGLGGAAPDTDLLGWTPPENTLLEIPAASLKHAPTLELIERMNQAQASFCLCDYEKDVPLPEAAAFRFVLADAKLQPRTLGAPGLLLATQLEDAAAFDAALKAGFDGAAGWFFLNTKPVAKNLVPAHAQIVRLLNLVRSDADMKDVEAVLKQDVALSFKLLRYINSAGFGLQCEIQSFRHAVTILGYSKLHKWLSLLLVTSSKDPAAPALMQASIARGRLMELVGRNFFNKSEYDNLFIVGAFSLLDVLLGAPMERALDQMNLPEAIADALLRGEGEYAPFLELARACEAQSADALAQQATLLQLAAEDVNRAQMQALSFADSLQFG